MLVRFYKIIKKQYSNGCKKSVGFNNFQAKMNPLDFRKGKVCKLLHYIKIACSPVIIAKLSVDLNYQPNISKLDTNPLL